MSTSKLNIFISLIALFLCTSNLYSQELLTSEIEQVSNKYVKKKKNKGLIIGIIKGDQQEIKSFGKLSQDKPFAPNKNTLFEIGSITSVFTTTMMMTSSQSGKIDLGDAIQGYLPEGIKAPKYHPYVCTEITLPPMLPNYEAERIVSCKPHPFAPDKCITFCDLASHTSALPNAPKGLYSWNPMRFFSQKKDPYQDYTKKEMYEKLHKYELTAAPGAYYKYSNLGIALLGNIVSDVNGGTYTDLLEQTILQPLDMQTTKFELSETELYQLAPGHNRKGKLTNHWHFKGMAPSGGLKSSVSDLLKFVSANLNTENTILADAFAQVHQSRLDIHERKFDRPTWMGYGWFISTLSKESNLPIVWQNGGTGGFRSFIGFNKDTQTGIVILSNSANSVDEMGFEILELLNKSNSANQFSDNKSPAPDGIFK